MLLKLNFNLRNEIIISLFLFDLILKMPINRHKVLKLLHNLEIIILGKMIFYPKKIKLRIRTIMLFIFIFNTSLKAHYDFYGQNIT